MVEIRVSRFWVQWVVMFNLKGFVVGLDTPVRTTKGWIRTIWGFRPKPALGWYIFWLICERGVFSRGCGCWVVQ
jgi:hypothetical protein